MKIPLHRKVLSHVITLLAIVQLLGLMACGQEKERDVFGVLPFSLEQVKLLDGPFKHAVDLNKKVLLNYEPDRLLARFLQEAGLPTSSEPYHGWEDNTISGHSLGHYLSAVAMMHQATGDPEFKKRATYIVSQLSECQRAHGNGYVGAIPNGKKIFEEQISHGDIRSQGFDLNGLWSPFYNYHKMMAGLRDAYQLLDIDQALIVEKGFADWVDSAITPLNEEQIQKVLDCEFGGMNEVLMDLYADTGDKKYLNLSRTFYHKIVMDSIADQKDILNGLHANTQIPKFIGLARDYEQTNNDRAKAAASFFWDRVANHHSYVTGGNSNHEYFGQPDQLRNRLSDGTTETCNVYNMLKLSNHLFEWQPRGDVADYYERALFNHILASQNPTDGKVIYNVSLEMGGSKYFQDPFAFTCCIGSGMETHSKYGGSIYFHNDNDLYISQFIASTLTWSERDIKVTQQTNFPKDQSTSLIFSLNTPQHLRLAIRYPYWAEDGIQISINDKEVEFVGERGDFIYLEREWIDGDLIQVNFPFSVRLEAMPDDSNRVAFLYGPLVLAGDLGPIDDPKKSEADYVPYLLVEDRNPSQWLTQIGSDNEFEIGSDIAKPRGFKLRPFYEIVDRTYSVYWDIFTEESLKHYRESSQAEVERRKKLEQLTFDFVQPGEMQPERDHNFQGDSVYIENMKDRKARVANRGGWFSFDMKVMTGQPMALVVDYWGGYTGSKTFDILVNDQKIATENISGKKDGSFIDVRYPIPDSLTLSANKITVKFVGHTGHCTGPVFGVRTVKR